MILQIRQERQKHNWSQNYVAKKIGITRTAYNHIENSLRKPSYDVLVKLEELFGRTHRELFAVANDEK